MYAVLISTNQIRALKITTGIDPKATNLNWCVYCDYKTAYLPWEEGGGVGCCVGDVDCFCPCIVKP